MSWWPLLIAVWIMGFVGLPFLFEVGSRKRRIAIQVSTAAYYVTLGGGIIVGALLVLGLFQASMDAYIAAQCDCCAPVQPEKPE